MQAKLLETSSTKASYKTVLPFLLFSWVPSLYSTALCTLLQEFWGPPYTLEK
jgi:hypothetical protein